MKIFLFFILAAAFPAISCVIPLTSVYTGKYRERNKENVLFEVFCNFHSSSIHLHVKQEQELGLYTIAWKDLDLLIEALMENILKRNREQVHRSELNEATRESGFRPFMHSKR